MKSPLESHGEVRGFPTHHRNGSEVKTAENYGPLLDRCLEQLHQGMQARNDAIAEPKGLVGGIAVMAAGSS